MRQFPPLGIFVLRRELVPSHYTYTEVDARPVEDMNLAHAPDPSLMGGAYGEIPSRRAAMPIITFLSPIFGRGKAAWEEELFKLGKHVVNPFAWTDAPPMGEEIQAGEQHTWNERYNIVRPPRASYGDEYTYEAEEDWPPTGW